MARPQSSFIRPRNFLEEERCDFAVSRRTLEPSVGRLGRRVFGTTSARAISSFSRARASARLASCVRSAREVMINTPSCVARLPANARRRRRTSAESKRDWPTSKRSWTAVETLLTFWPPGPEARTNVIVSSESGMNVGKCYLQNSLCCSRFVALALDEEGLHILVLQDLHGCLLGSVALRDREERLLRLSHHRAREVILVDGVVFGRHGPVQQWHDVAKDARRVGVAENDGGAVHAKEVELNGLDSLLLLADDLRVLHPGLGVRTRCCHEPAHTNASSLGGSAKGLRVGDFDLAHLLLGHLRAALADAERGERNVYSLGVRRNLPLESVHVDNHGGDLGVGERVHVAARHHHYLLAPRVLDQNLHDACA